MKYSLNSLLILTTFVACANGGWPSYGRYVLTSVFVFAAVAITAHGLLRSKHPRKYFVAGYGSAIGLTILVLSIGPATGFLVRSDGTNKTVIEVYRWTYTPVTDFVAFFPVSIHRSCRVYLDFWLPTDACLDDRWPLLDPGLVVWSVPNGKDRINLMVPRKRTTN
jgi:hypothetical protein